MAMLMWVQLSLNPLQPTATDRQPPCFTKKLGLFANVRAFPSSLTRLEPDSAKQARCGPMSTGI